MTALQNRLCKNARCVNVEAGKRLDDIASSRARAWNRTTGATREATQRPVQSRLDELCF